jgi:hypothetical protein
MCFHTKQSKSATQVEKRFKAKIDNRPEREIEQKTEQENCICSGVKIKFKQES